MKNGESIELNGVVYIDDIEGDQNMWDGIVCSTNHSSDCVDQYWSYENGTKVPRGPGANLVTYTYGDHSTFYANTVRNTSCSMTLYTSGSPTERGLFKCTITLNATSRFAVNASVYIVDMDIHNNVIGSTEVIAGDPAKFSVNVTILTENVSVLYQWQKNGIVLRNGETKLSQTSLQEHMMM